MASKSPTQRTLEYLKERGWDYCKVERYNPFGGKKGVRIDMFGFGDYVAMDENSIIAIQSCGQAFSEHNKKITQDEIIAPLATKWLRCSGRLMLIGWRKVKLKRGGKAMRWKPRIMWYDIVDDKIKGKEIKEKI